jgi:hypothetical protein
MLVLVQKIYLQAANRQQNASANSFPMRKAHPVPHQFPSNIQPSFVVTLSSVVTMSVQWPNTSSVHEHSSRQQPIMDHPLFPKFHSVLGRSLARPGRDSGPGPIRHYGRIRPASRSTFRKRRPGLRRSRCRSHVHTSMRRIPSASCIKQVSKDGDASIW